MLRYTSWSGRTVVPVIACLLFLIVSLPRDTFGGQVKARVVCYYGQWANSIGQIPGDKCTHVIYSFIGLNESNWQIKFLENNDKVTKGKIRQFISLRQSYPEVKLLIAVGGGGKGSANYSQMAETPSRRSIFIQSLVEFMKRYTFDGLDMDWEYPGVKRKGGRAVDKGTFVSFLQELRSAFNAQQRGWQISLAASVVEANIKNGYDVPALCKIVDAVHLTNYNMRGVWNAFADVPSPMYPRPTDVGAFAKLNTEGGTFLWSNAGCPRYKLIVGVPFYGRELVLRNALNNKPGDPIDQEASRQLPRGGALAYSQICRQLQGNNGWTRTFDDTVKCPYMTRGNRWVGYEDEESVQVKMDWIQKEGMGGAMIWAINYDDLNGDCGPRLHLISVIYSNLKDLVLITA